MGLHRQSWHTLSSLPWFSKTNKPCEQQTLPNPLCHTHCIRREGLEQIEDQRPCSCGKSLDAPASKVNSLDLVNSVCALVLYPLFNLGLPNHLRHSFLLTCSSFNVSPGINPLPFNPHAHMNHFFFCIREYCCLDHHVACGNKLNCIWGLSLTLCRHQAHLKRIKTGHWENYAPHSQKQQPISQFAHDTFFTL
jgi:hypothetical protein